MLLVGSGERGIKGRVIGAKRSGWLLGALFVLATACSTGGGDPSALAAAPVATSEATTTLASTTPSWVTTSTSTSPTTATTVPTTQARATTTAASTTQKPAPTTADPPTTVLDTSIRQTDWASLTYEVDDPYGTSPIVPTREEYPEQGWVFADAVYGDLNGDGREDALVVLRKVGHSTQPLDLFAMVAGDEPMRGLERRRLTVMLFPSDNPPTYSIVDSQIRLTGEERGNATQEASPELDVSVVAVVRDGTLVELERTVTPKPDGG